MWMVFVIVFDPISYQFLNGFRIRLRVHTDVVTLERLHKPLHCGLATGVKQGFNPSWRAKMRVSLAVNPL